MANEQLPERASLEYLKKLAKDRLQELRRADPNAQLAAAQRAAARGHVEAARLLLRHGADPNAREAGDHTYPLHWAAAHGHLEVVRALLDAGGDVHGMRDVHELDVIGWATVFRHHDIPRQVVAL